MSKMEVTDFYSAQAVNLRSKYLQLQKDFEKMKEVVDLFDKSRLELDKYYED